MTGHQVEKTLQEILQGAAAVYSVEELRARLASGKKLRVKLGMDPTAPDLHLGHSVVLDKLRQFQDFGHKAVLIIGDYTAMIGDPTGRSKTRPMLTPEEIDQNAASYFAQAGKVLDLDPAKLEIRRNSEWLSGMSCADVIRLLSCMTVARMLERDTFDERRKEGREIFLHELLYPLMQARDSVAVEADVELGGTDQTFNNLCGRDLQRVVRQSPQIVLVCPILIGTDGTQKMSKSLGNHIALTDEPGDMFGKIMSIPDAQMRNYFELLTDLPADQIDLLSDPNRSHPRESKERLGRWIVTRFHDAGAAEHAAIEFRRVHAGGGLPDDLPEVRVPEEVLSNGHAVPLDLVMLCGFAKSRGEGRRLIAEGGVQLNGQVVSDAFTPVRIASGDVMQRGRRTFARLIP